MAESGKRARRPSFYEVVMKGSPKVAVGFLAGLALGSGTEQEIYYCHEDAIEEQEEGLSGRLADFLRLHPQDCRAIVGRPLRDQLRRLRERIEAETGLQVLALNHVRSAELTFHYEAYALRYAEQIQARLDDLPAGLRLLDHEKQENIDPDARGVEIYSPTHDYEIKGHGRIVGRVDLVIRARRELDAHPLIHVGRIELKRA